MLPCCDMTACFNFQQCSFAIVELQHDRVLEGQLHQMGEALSLRSADPASHRDMDFGRTTEQTGSVLESNCDPRDPV